MTTTRKNYYEELIDAIILDEVCGSDVEVRSMLKGLDISKKRLALLSILDKDRGVFNKIKSEIEGNDVSATKHIKDVVEMLRVYVEVGDKEQKKYGEVFTKYSTINEMFDLLEDDFWSNPLVKVLDPCAGIGNFSVVLVERFMNGLANFEPNQEKRYKYIVENIIFACELQHKNAFLYLASFDPKDIYELNIFNESFLSKEFDEHMINVWGVEKFDLICMNSPYQFMDGGNGASATPLYNKFIEKTLSICNKLLSIHPSRWMAGGKGLENFRGNMINSNKIKIIKHFENSQSVFGKNVDIEGGVQFFLMDNNYNGDCLFNDIKIKLNKYDILLTNNKAQNIVDKIMNLEPLSRICRTRSTYPIRTNDDRLKDTKIDDNHIICYVSKQKGFIKYIHIDYITRNKYTIPEFKVITARANGKYKKFGNTFIGNPKEICTDSYISFKVNSKEEAENLISYMNTKFCNFMLGLRKITQDIKPDTCKWIPLVDLSKSWTDKELYQLFNLTLEEIDIIENS